MEGTARKAPKGKALVVQFKAFFAVRQSNPNSSLKI
jgi:hypothetical protein